MNARIRTAMLLGALALVSSATVLAETPRPLHPVTRQSRLLPSERKIPLRLLYLKMTFNLL